MRQLLLIMASLVVSSPILADASYEALLNTVILTFNADQWVTTQTALVTIGVNASVSGNALEKTQSQVLTKLNQISNKGEWHIISFNRNLDQSGLERVQLSAQARLSSSDLGGLRDKAKGISVPGETYTLDNVEFTPSEEEFRQANTALRNSIYSQITTEIATLNKLYPDQHYYLHTADFVGNMIPQPMSANNNTMMYARAAAAPMMKTAMAVGNKLNLSATVVIASAPSADVTKIIHQ